MKVKELILKLGKLNQDAEVYVSRDEEGNGYGTISPKSIHSYGKCGRSVVIFPWEEHVEVPGLE